MAIISHDSLQQLIVQYRDYAYPAIGLIVGLESMGIPLPGETILVLAAVYAAATGDLNIYAIVAATIIGSTIGDNLGYSIGKRYGYPMLLKHGHKMHLNEGRIKLGQYLFMKYGAMIVFLGRFIALLRILAAFLAGVNQMNWWRFFFANFTGAILWASVFGFGGYLFGQLVFQVHKQWAPVIIGAAIVGFFAVGFILRQNEKRLIEVAKAALPGPLIDPAK